VTVKARIDGQLDEVDFTEGQDVKAGQVLVRSTRARCRRSSRKRRRRRRATRRSWAMRAPTCSATPR
jgi:multidrug efflux pump subunit AcrA (membrane-fusion protein)